MQGREGRWKEGDSQDIDGGEEEGVKGREDSDDEG